MSNQNNLPDSSRRSTRNIASRLFQFALSGGQEINVPNQLGYDLNVSGQPRNQSSQQQISPNNITSQRYNPAHESYQRLRDHLFPTSAHAIPNTRSTPSSRALQSSRLHQLAHTARINNAVYQASLDGNPLRSSFEPRSNADSRRAQRDSNLISRGSANIAAMHPSFRSKAVCELGCSFCEVEICKRGMRAILLADTSVFLLIIFVYYSSVGGIV